MHIIMNFSIHTHIQALILSKIHWIIFILNLNFVAKFVGIKSPIPYFWKDYAGKKRLQYGMNFAYGGTGVFKTQVPLPNMTTQIDFFQNILTAGDIYSPSDFSSSVALVSVAGNDYSTFIAQNRPNSVRKKHYISYLFCL